MHAVRTGFLSPVGVALHMTFVYEYGSYSVRRKTRMIAVIVAANRYTIIIHLFTAQLSLLG